MTMCSFMVCSMTFRTGGRPLMTSMNALNNRARIFFCGKSYIPCLRHALQILYQGVLPKNIMVANNPILVYNG